MIAVVVMASAGILVSCVELETEQPLADAVGYLVAPSLEVDVTVDDLQLTKALDFTVEQPSESDIRFVVKDKDGNVKHEGNGLWSEPLVLPVGSYTIEAAAGTNTYGAPYFAGTASGTVEALDREVPELKLALANSLLRVTVSDELKTHFTPSSIVVLAEGAYNATYGEWFYAPSGSDISLSLSGKSSTDGDVTFNYTLTSPSPKVAYDVVCDKATTNWPTITISEISQNDAWASRVYITALPTFTGNISPKNKASVVYEAIPSTSSDWTSAESAVTENGVLVIKDLTPGTEYQVRARVGALISNVVKVTPALDGFSATASHTYSGGELDGTNVTSTFSKPDVVKNSIASWSINLCKSDGTELRSELPLGTSVGAAITATNGWPYLPAGSYKLVAQATMKDGEVVENIISDSFSTDAPSFTVTASAYTSYDKYLLRDLNFANDVANKHTVFERRASVSISDYILANTNYSDIRSSSITFNSQNIGSFNTHSKDFGNDANCTSWQNYPFKATMTFDGVTKESSVDCHITGLPYTAAPPSNDSQKTGGHPWTEDQRASGGGTNFIWTDSEFYMYDDAAVGTYLRVGTPLFNVPNDINIAVVVSSHGCRHALINSNVDCTVYSGESKAGFTAKYNSGNYADYPVNSLTLYKSSPKLQLENSEHTAYCKLYINKVTITYR